MHFRVQLLVTVTFIHLPAPLHEVSFSARVDLSTRTQISFNINRFSSLRYRWSQSLRNQIRTVSEILTSERQYLHLPFRKAIKFPRYSWEPCDVNTVEAGSMAASKQDDLHMLCQTESEGGGEEETRIIYYCLV